MSIPPGLQMFYYVLRTRCCRLLLTRLVVSDGITVIEDRLIDV
jgi:hypothetical protein